MEIIDLCGFCEIRDPGGGINRSLLKIHDLVVDGGEMRVGREKGQWRVGRRGGDAAEGKLGTERKIGQRRTMTTERMRATRCGEEGWGCGGEGNVMSNEKVN